MDRTDDIEELLVAVALGIPEPEEVVRVERAAARRLEAQGHERGSGGETRALPTEDRVRMTREVFAGTATSVTR